MSETIVCTSCGKKKNLHDGGEILKDHETLIKSNDHLPEEFHGMCYRCTQDELKFRVKLHFEMINPLT